MESSHMQGEIYFVLCCLFWIAYLNLWCGFEMPGPSLEQPIEISILHTLDTRQKV